MMKTNIVVKFDLEGRHCWPDAPDMYRLLRSRHSHIFHFEVHIPVTESRQLEFLDVRRELIRVMLTSYGNEPCDFRGRSCEQLCLSVWRSVENVYKVTPDKVVVMEDSFVGSEVLNG